MEPSYLQETKPLHEKKAPPKDKFNLIYAALILHGFGILIPWNMFITAAPYFMQYKLNVTMGDPEDKERLANLRDNFLNLVGFSAQTPNLICNALNLLIHQSSSNLGLRIVICLVLQAFLILLNIILAIVDSSDWPFTFFYVTLFSIVIIYSGTGVYQNCIYGIAAKMPMEYSNSVVIGSNICGTITSIIMIVSLMATPDLRSSAIIYFLIALLILLICLATYFLFNLSPFYRYYNQDPSAKKLSDEKPTDEKPTDEKPKRPPIMEILGQIWPQCFNVFLTFFLTLALFPNVLAQIKSYDNVLHVPDKFFSPIFCFFVFNTAALVGNLVPSYMTWPGPKRLWLLTSNRLLLIPFFLFCNYIPNDREWPVFFRSDFLFFLGSVFLGLSQGYCSSLGMMFASNVANPEHAGFAGMLAAFFLVFGLFCGVNFSFFLTWVVKKDIL